ncbi:MAG: hypothetical protein PHQ35_07190 [Phycisphaerae bacterium]|nr:hypothetical protein [Phycisphaerae bacterium]MDD5381013.1 hypothetical protein [Phycisphaerae bacterium]
MGIKKHIELLAKSSSSETPYTVECYLEGNKMLVFCSCRAGDNRMLCKHVRKIIAGDESILYDRNQKNELEKISNHLQKTQIPLLLLEMNKSEDLLEEAKRNAEKAKKNLENVILNKLKQ